MSSALYLFSTTDHLDENMDQLKVLNNSFKNDDIFILFLDQLSNINSKENIHKNISFMFPEDIGLNDLAVKQLSFSCTRSNFNLTLFPLIVNYLKSKHYHSIMYAGHYHAISAEITDYFYNYYEDNQLILKSDREKYLNMHELEKEMLGNPYAARDKIRNIKRIVCADVDHDDHVIKIDDTNGVKTYKIKADHLITNLSGSQLVLLFLYILSKIYKKIIIKLLKIMHIYR